MSSRRTRVRSSLPHQFPTFYACYLLKSIRTPRSVATYIGSTPSPPRRIRQHNGEISQGAWKTKQNRPWIMQMLVHGFPSRLAALQFEWAWQHPHVSRHLRDGDGKSVFTSDARSKYIKLNIKVARVMLSSSPYDTWPLQVKFFTQEAVEIWDALEKNTAIPPLPRGFVSQIELEGVDGKSGLRGSGRVGPVDITDDSFTSAHLAKHNALMASGKPLSCSVCSSHLQTYATDALSAALCPNGECSAVSHLTCLSDHFLSSEGLTLVPRGGECPSCKTYTLWGDVVKGSYRRHAGRAIPMADDIADEDEGGEVFGAENGNAELSTPPPASPIVKRARKKVAESSPSRSVPVRASPPKRGRGRPRKAPAKAQSAARSYHSGVRPSSAEEEFFDLNAISEDDEADDAPPPPRYRAATAATTMSRTGPSKLIGADDEPDGAPPLLAVATSTPAMRRPPGGVGPSSSKATEGKASARSFLSLGGSGESFDLNAISEDSEEDGVPPAPAKTIINRKRPRPHKASKGKQRPNFDIFFTQDLADSHPSSHRLPSAAPSSSEDDAAFSLASRLPIKPSAHAQGQQRLALLEGEADFFGRYTDDSSSGSHPGLVSAGGTLPDIADALSTLSVSSPAPSPLPKRTFTRRPAVEVVDISD
ncbi:hypothetical protein FA95DRAFT_1676875 [Auriscalpium vulgare]|uniref:Uncharacterized protein n=1 Tax=Auriscalpium vulgare TaxID=40419 RepID=A0ACB8S2R6_9AGAM|nr:hypothetical protein FA95DRAFT_1676875 [Auriscalpium vulgare]